MRTKYLYCHGCTLKFAMGNAGRTDIDVLAYAIRESFVVVYPAKIGKGTLQHLCNSPMGIEIRIGEEKAPGGPKG